MKIGFIGLGLMGSAMCANIIKKNPEEVFCFDVLPEKTAEVAAMGAAACAGALELAEKSDVIITMVPKSEHSRGVCESILPALGPGKIYIDMSTISPDVSVEISEKVKSTGAQFADCPVVKSRPAALKGELGIYAGCDEELFPVIEPVLRYMGTTVIYMGKNGMGLVMKLCHNTLVAQIQNGVNETLALANRFGIDAYRFHEAVVCGGAQNFY
ncbi:MAG: NAD(P)-dependent oxidoreductase, partial [Clostridia bacterium]|nr:NAD(P)-dependent oxidoreductase [Clostridia bacterium]